MTKKPSTFCQILIVLTIVHSSISFVAFDCSGPSINITKLSLLDSYECPSLENPITKKNVSIQLIQLKRWEHIHVYACKIKVMRQIFHCGMHSHSSAVHGGLAEYIVPVSKSQCLMIHETNSYMAMGTYTITNLQTNSTTYRSVTMGGSLTSDARCTGSSFSDHLGSWDNVVVQAAFTISLYDTPALYDIEEEYIQLKSGVRCRSQTIECIDPDLGYVYHKTTTLGQCNPNRHIVLYEGLATRMTESFDGILENKPVIYLVQTNGISFSFSVKGKTHICGLGLITTDHPRLVIHAPSDGMFYFTKNEVPTEDMDMFAYINSKFVYVEQHMKTQLNSLYENTIRHKCELEKQIVHNLLNLALLSPELFAFSYMKQSGYTAIVSGEVINVIKCHPIDVQIRTIDRCFIDIPVTYKNKSLFITPRNHILVSKGREVTCAPMLYPMYHLSDQWYEFSPQLHSAVTPDVIRLSTTSYWKYESPYDLAKSGIYSATDIEKLRNHIMFPTERAAVLNILAQGTMNMHPDTQQISLVHMMDQDTLEKITSSYMERVWGWFVWLGNAVSGIMGLWLSFKVLCFIWNTIVHGLSLYHTFGISMKLLTAVSGSLSSYFLHKAKMNKHSQTSDVVLTSSKQDDKEYIPLPVIESPKFFDRGDNIYPSISTELKEATAPTDVDQKITTKMNRTTWSDRNV